MTALASSGSAPGEARRVLKEPVMPELHVGKWPRAKLVFIAFAAVAAVLLIAEHRTPERSADSGGKP
jgi:hypothetical protein